jgi:hypothetical protein
VAAALADELARERDAWRALWLRAYKPEGLEVSSGVFDRAIAALRAVGAPSPAVDPRRWLPLDLDAAFDQAFADVAAVPIGLAAVDGVPLRFAPLARTHARLDASRTAVEASFAPTPVRDLHLVVASPRPADETRSPGLRVELRRAGRAVFTEDLRRIEHLCDWWAPLGEHMWAGGGYAYVDRARVAYALSPGHNYGLCRVHGFAAGGVEADGLALSALDGAQVEVFAATVERGGGDNPTVS